METETAIETAPVETIIFDPPIEVNTDIIAGGMIVSTADVIQQDDKNYVVTAIYGDGRVIAVPFVDSNENSIRVALS
jgi:hypothetical protein